MTAPADTVSTVIPCLRCRHAHAAMAWLQGALGFAPQAVHADGAWGRYSVHAGDA